jgi:phosphoenolpyruvate synthase/pyruvate phosphate dikinase
VIDPVAWGARLRQRQHDFDLLRHLEPPYIVDSRTGPPPIQDWSPRGGSAVVPAAAGEVLRGAPASPGHASGRVRVVFDPASAEIQPGDVLVCRTTDPSWSPLFMACSAVICNVGAIGSHAAIVARELGVPCVVSLVDATSRIPDGAMVEVDGTAGFVRIVSM